MEGAVFQLMSWMMMEFLRVGLLLGMENELADLKGVVDFKELNDGGFINLKDWELNVDLLNTLEAADVNLIRDGMNLIYDCQQNFRLINEIEPEELVFDEPVVDQATDLYSYWIEAGTAYESYDAILFGVEQLYWDAMFVLYLCTVMFTRNTLEVWDGEDPFLEYCDRRDEISAEAADHKNVRLLFGLINQLEQHNEKWMECRYEHHKKKNGQV